MISEFGFNTYPAFIMNVIETFKRKDFAVQSLGTVMTGDDVYVCGPRRRESQCPNVLIAAGFHGDEPGGSYAVARFIERVSRESLRDVNLTVLPAVNPSGLRLGRRCDAYDADPNRGLCHHEGNDVVGEVGEMLIDRLDFFAESARDGFLTLHEDGDIDGAFYLLREDATSSSRAFCESLLTSASRHMRPLSEGLHHEHYIVGGVGSWFCDTSFEDVLSHVGVRRIYVLEMSSNARAGLRADLGASVIESFVSGVTL